MEKKFHLVNGEPKPCTASVRDCPIGGEHFATGAEARSSYEYENNKNLFNNTHKKNSHNNNKKIMIAAAAALAVVGAGGAALTAANAGSPNNMGAEYAKTPYSVSVSSNYNFGDNTYSAKIMDSNLKETNFDSCVNDHTSVDKYLNHGDTLTCKTVDGKFQVAIKHGGKMDTFDKVSIKINDGKVNTTINNNKVYHDNTSYIIPSNSITK